MPAGDGRPHPAVPAPLQGMSVRVTRNAPAVPVTTGMPVATAIPKRGHGREDTVVIPCPSATTQAQMPARVPDEVENFDILPDAPTGLLTQDLGEGLAQALCRGGLSGRSP